LKTLISLALLSLITLSANAYTDPKVGGMVTLKPELAKKIVKGGVLYVFAKKAGPDSGPNDRTPPVAVIKVLNPNFPQAFVITQKDVMIAGTPFSGPLHVVARYSPTGDAMRAPGALEGMDSRFPSVELGNKDLKIDLNIEIK
jgi:hypothetical protein